MAKQETMSQEQVRLLLGNGERKKIGDGSRYGKRHTKGVMNKCEAEFAFQLEARKRNGEIKSWSFETDQLVLDSRTSMLMDFTVVHLDDSIEQIDVKHEKSIDPKAIVKIKWAKQKYPHFAFALEIKLSNGGWKRRVIKG